MGDGHRQRRRPRLFSTLSMFMLLLARLSPPSIPCSGASGDSDTEVQARFPTSLHWKSSPQPPSTPNRCFLGDSDASSWVHLPVPSKGDTPVDLELLRFLCLGLAGAVEFRSEAKELLTIDTNPSSEPFSRLRSRFVSASFRLWLALCISEKSRSMFNPFLSPLVGSSKRSHYFNPTGACKLSCCSSRQDRYNSPTPIVLNLKSKFIVDIGVLHNSVMVKAYLSSDICNRRVVLECNCIYPRTCAVILIGRYYRSCHKYYRLRAALLTGPYVSVLSSCLALKGKLLVLHSHGVATNFIDSVGLINTPESYRRQDDFQAEASSLKRKLGKHLCFMGLGPKFVTFWLTFRMGCEPTSKLLHRDYNSKYLGSKISNVEFLLILNLYLEGFVGLDYVSEDLLTHDMSLCIDLNVIAYVVSIVIAL